MVYMSRLMGAYKKTQDACPYMDVWCYSAVLTQIALCVITKWPDDWIRLNKGEARLLDFVDTLSPLSQALYTSYIVCFLTHSLNNYVYDNIDLLYCLLLLLILNVW